MTPLILSCSTNNSNDFNGILFFYQSYIDISNQYTIHQFKKIPFKDKNLSLGFFKGTVFIKIKITNTTAKKKTIVIYNNDKLNRNYSFYRLDTAKNKLIYQKEEKEIRYRDSRSFDSNTPNFKITLQANKAVTYYIHTTSDGRVLQGNLSAISLKDYIKKLKYETCKHVFFYSFVIIILMVNFFYWRIFKKRIYTFYILYIVFTFFMNFGLDGYLFGYGINHIVDHLIFIFIRLTALMLLLFTSSFLNIKETHPKFHVFLKYYSISIVICITTYQLLFFKTAISNLHFIENIIALHWLFFILILIALSIEKKWTETKFYLLGLLSFVLLATLGILDYNIIFISKFYLDYSFFLKIGTLLELTIFTYTTAVVIKKNNNEVTQLKINLINKEKDYQSKVEEHILYEQNLEATNTKLQSKLTKISVGKIEKTDFLAIFKLLESNLTNENEWTNFKKKFQELNPYFLTNLYQKHPNLSKTDIRLLVLVKIGFTQKEISQILFIAESSVKKAKQRVRKKIKIPFNVVLSRYLSNI